MAALIAFVVGVPIAVMLSVWSAFRPHVESLVDTYFDLIDEMTAELERRRMVD